MKAIIIAAGIGSRLGDLTKDLPKPLVDVNGKSILQRQIEIFNKFGIDEIIIIRGPHKEKFNFKNVTYVEDTDVSNHDLLGSLMTGEKEMNDLVFQLRQGAPGFKVLLQGTGLRRSKIWDNNVTNTEVCRNSENHHD